MNSSFTKSQRTTLQASIAVLAVAAIGLQAAIDPLRRQPAIESRQVTNTIGQVGNTGAALPFEYTLGALAGFRQVIAGLLWVRSDSFFHSGNYDAILPLIRLITWLDPNWLDPYATGAWHMMYNFTDTDQRSDRRYLPAGIALLKEGIANNSGQYDMYKELGWNYYDKMKDFEHATYYYDQAMKNDPKFDITQVEHALAHCYEKTGRIDKAIETWEDAAKRHKAIADDPTAASDVKARESQGYQNAVKNLFIDRVRKFHRATQTQPPVDVQFVGKVTRKRPLVLQIEGTWNLVGAVDFDAGPFKTNSRPDLQAVKAVTDFGKGITAQGPVDGARVDVRLQDADYVMPQVNEFNFDLDSHVTIMQDQISTRGGKVAHAGSVYFWHAGAGDAMVDTDAQHAGVYGFATVDGAAPGVPLDKALAGAAPISAEGQRQLATLAKEPFDKLKADPAKIAELTRAGYCIATQNRTVFGHFSKEIDMSKDPKMYGFYKDKYVLIFSINPRSAPDFVQDRIGWTGNGWTDKRYLKAITTQPTDIPQQTDIPPSHWIRQEVQLTRDDITGNGEKVLIDDSKQ